MKTNLFALLVVVLLSAGLLGACTPRLTADAAVACPEPSDSVVVNLDCREVTIAVENAYLPFSYVLKDGTAAGWDYDTWREICTRLNCTPKFVETGWDGLIQSVSDKLTDVGADGITNSPERQQIVDFSIGYIQINQRLLVRKGETRFFSIEEFAADPSLVLGTQSGTTNYETAATFLSEGRIQAFEQMPFAVQALISGDVDAVLIDEIAGMGYQGENSGNLELTGSSISSDELGFIFPKGSDLVDPVNKALEAMRADGTLERINNLYFSPNFNITDEDLQGN